MATDRFAFHLVLHSAALIEEQLRKRLSLINMRPRQARIIDALARMEPATQIALARAFHVSPASMSTMTARLIDGGFVTREVDPEETRSNILRLTTRGRGLLSDIHAAWADIDAMIAAQIGPEKSAHLATLTLELRDALGGTVPGRSRALEKSREPENDI